MNFATPTIETGPTDIDHCSSGLLFRFEAVFGLLPIGLIPEGLRMAHACADTASASRFRGAEVRDTDRLISCNDAVATPIRRTNNDR